MPGDFGRFTARQKNGHNHQQNKLWFKTDLDDISGMIFNKIVFHQTESKINSSNHWGISLNNTIKSIFDLKIIIIIYIQSVILKYLQCRIFCYIYSLV